MRSEQHKKNTFIYIDSSSALVSTVEDMQSQELVRELDMLIACLVKKFYVKNKG